MALGWGASAGASYAAAAGMTGSAIFLGIPLWGWIALTVVLLGTALYMTWQAWATDDQNFLPLEYWLDNGTFGSRKSKSGDLALRSPWVQNDRTVAPFMSLKEELDALQEVLFSVQGRVWAATDRGGYSIVCSYDVAVPKSEVGSKLKLAFTVIDEGKRIDVGAVICQNGEPATTSNTIHPGLKGMRDGPHLKTDIEAGVLRVSGLFSTLRDPLLFGWLKEKDRIYADQVEMELSYWPDEVGQPEFVSRKRMVTQ